jgi:hypothetical protein
MVFASFEDRRQFNGKVKTPRGSFHDFAKRLKTLALRMRTPRKRCERDAK